MDVHNWSGLAYYMAKSMENQGMTLEYIGPLETRNHWLWRGKSFLLRLLGKRFLWNREPAVLKQYAEQIAARLENSNADIVFSPGTLPISYLECPQPVAVWTGATFASMLNFYPNFSNVYAGSIKVSHASEQRALSRASLAIFPSEWGAEGAKANYLVDPAKIAIVPYGPNLEGGFTRQQVKAAVKKRLNSGCNLLFVGRDWYRKGGDIALETSRQLRVRGIQAYLGIVGCSPPDAVPEYVTVYGYLSKKSVESEILLKRLYSSATFLIMPSRAENFGVAIAEASSFGVPSLTSDVGGIPSALQDGQNGRRFSSPLKAEQICDYVLDLIGSPGKYSALAESSFELYLSTLNWQTAGNKIKALFERLI
jgi:hypothetical protein